MVNRKRNAQSARPRAKRILTKCVTLHVSPDKLKGFPTPRKAGAGMADPTQGACTGLRSQSRSAPAHKESAILPTPTVDHASNTPTSVTPSTKRSILKPSSRKGQRKSGKQVTIQEDPDVRTLSASPPPAPASKLEKDMSGVGRPKLKINFSKLNTNLPSAPQSPEPQSAVRTPSLKLNVKPPPSFPPAPKPVSQPKAKKSICKDGKPAKPAGKKRKQPVEEGQEPVEDEIALAQRPPQIRKITFTNKQATPATAVTPGATPIIKIKHKGKIPKRPLGVGYDSELSDREVDPTLLEAFILRMPHASPDSDYVRDAINNGTIGIHRSQGGADIQLKFLDRHGRRAVLSIQQRRYAATLVDLPCIIEGMKSWDKKGWIKSADLCQMLLVLGRVVSDEDAQNYKLPPDVDPKTFQYAHGITPPMRFVRQRRFARTNRAQVSDIEDVERKVAQMLADDAAAMHVKHELIDPEQLESRNQSMEYSGDEYDEEEDAEGEEVEAEAVSDNYFDAQNGETGEMVETPTYAETPAAEVDEEDINELEQFLESEEDEEQPHAAHSAVSALAEHNGLRRPEGDSSFAATSASASPAQTTAHTPLTAAGTTSGDEEGDDGDGEDDDGDDAQSTDSMDDAEKEGTENLQLIREKIQEMEEKIQEQMEQMNKQPNQIIRRKILMKIEALKGDVEQMRNTAGLREDDD